MPVIYSGGKKSYTDGVRSLTIFSSVLDGDSHIFVLDGDSHILLMTSKSNLNIQCCCTLIDALICECIRCMK